MEKRPLSESNNPYGFPDVQSVFLSDGSPLFGKDWLARRPKLEEMARIQRQISQELDKEVDNERNAVRKMLDK